MNKFCLATKNEIRNYRDSDLGKALCGSKPFGSRHWEYPWAVKQSNIVKKKGLRILDIAPDFTFPYGKKLEELGHHLTFIDLERQQWSEKVCWGIDHQQISENYQIMDVRQMSFADESFDCIFCISVLEHIVCPTQDPHHPELHKIFNPIGARPAISEMRRCLKLGGQLLITVDIYGGINWKSYFDQWDIFADLKACGFSGLSHNTFDKTKAFKDQENFISQFHGPYITLGFKLTK